MAGSVVVQDVELKSVKGEMNEDLKSVKSMIRHEEEVIASVKTEIEHEKEEIASMHNTQDKMEAKENWLKKVVIGLALTMILSFCALFGLMVAAADLVKDMNTNHDGMLMTKSGSDPKPVMTHTSTDVADVVLFFSSDGKTEIEREVIFEQCHQFNMGSTDRTVRMLNTKAQLNADFAKFEVLKTTCTKDHAIDDAFEAQVMAQGSRGEEGKEIKIRCEDGKANCVVSSSRSGRSRSETAMATANMDERRRLNGLFPGSDGQGGCIEAGRDMMHVRWPDNPTRFDFWDYEDVCKCNCQKLHPEWGPDFRCAMQMDDEKYTFENGVVPLSYGFWYCYKEGTDPSCFPKSSKVELDDGQVKTMDQIQIGDSVKTLNSNGKVIFSEVFLISHAVHDKISEYVELGLSTGHSIRLSRDHYLPRASGASNGAAMWPDAAQNVEVGDRVMVMVDASPVEATVDSISIRSIEGAYNPITLEGSIIVDGVLASCYTADLWLPEWMASLVRARAPAYVAQIGHATTFLPRSIYKAKGARWFEMAVAKTLDADGGKHTSILDVLKAVLFLNDGDADAYHADREAKDA